MESSSRGWSHRTRSAPPLDSTGRLVGSQARGLFVPLPVTTRYNQIAADRSLQGTRPSRVLCAVRAVPRRLGSPNDDIPTSLSKICTAPVSKVAKAGRVASAQEQHWSTGERDGEGSGKGGGGGCGVWGKWSVGAEGGCGAVGRVLNAVVPPGCATQLCVSVDRWACGCFGLLSATLGMPLRLCATLATNSYQLPPDLVRQPGPVELRSRSVPVSSLLGSFCPPIITIPPIHAAIHAATTSSPQTYMHLCPTPIARTLQISITVTLFSASRTSWP